MVTVILSLVACVALPLSLLVILKSNAGVMFLAACTGIVLLQSLDPAVVTTAGAVIPMDGESIVRLLVVLMSLIFAAVMFRQTIRNSQLALHIAVTVLIGVTLWLVLPASTGLSTLLDTSSMSLWREINEFRTLIIATGFSLSLLAILMAKPPKHEKSKHH